MRQLLILFTIILFIPFFSRAKTYKLIKGDDLQAVLNIAADGDTIKLDASAFYARGLPFLDSLCGNCLNPREPVYATRGFVVKDKSLLIIGAGQNKTKLFTNAGYGMFFENSANSIVKNLTITGGKRDDDGNATDAAIVVRSSRVLIENCDIRDNDNRSEDSTVVVGIGGIFGRERADITIRNCNIINNGWDGVALYRGATALITDCIIKDGRGAGIGVTWDAACTAYRNEISGYWKGIGAFGTSWVIARNNSVHDNLGWGIIATGQSYMDITNNVVHYNGNCGIAPWSNEARGRIVNNIVTENGWRKQWVCPCVGVWNNGDWAKWQFAHNIVWNNKEGNYENIFDQTELNGNLSIDPLQLPDSNFRLQINSPALNAGDTTIYNPDGSVSHIGTYGGPQAKKAEN